MSSERTLTFKKSIALSLGAIIGLALVQPATAAAPAPGPLEPRFRTQRVYFHCAEFDRSGNAAFLAANEVPQWNTTPPSQSFLGEAAGCLTADLNTGPQTITPQENPTDGVWKGTFTGNLKALTVSAHCICFGASRLDGGANIGVRITIDGEPIVGDGTTERPIVVTEQNSGVTQLYEFSVSQIGFVEPNDDIDGDGVGDNPYGSVEHNLTLTLDGKNPATNLFGLWAYDSTEVPSGILFNPTFLIPPVIQSAV